MDLVVNYIKNQDEYDKSVVFLKSFVKFAICKVLGWMIDVHGNDMKLCNPYETKINV